MPVKSSKVFTSTAEGRWTVLEQPQLPEES